MKEDIDYLTVDTVYIPKSGCCGYYTSLYVLPVRRWLSISGGNQASTFGIASTLGYEAGQWQSPWPVPSCPGHSYWAGTSVVLPSAPPASAVHPDIMDLLPSTCMLLFSVIRRLLDYYALTWWLSSIRVEWDRIKKDVNSLLGGDQCVYNTVF